MTIDPRHVLTELFEAEPNNRFDDPELGRLCDPPLVGVADARDPWFERFAALIGPFHWTPQHALRLSAPQAEARSVICWSLSVAQEARAANRRETRFPARSWAYARSFGDRIVTRLRHGLQARLRAAGFAALAPAVAPQNEVRYRPPLGLAACWSERHVAFVAGLGTFGLSGGLITCRGVAHRLGSVVTDLETQHTARPYGDDPFAWCLGSSEGTCGDCIRRCPAGAIGDTVHARDTEACRRHVRDVIAPLGPRMYGWEGRYGCGLCQTAVPCEYCLPEREQPSSGSTATAGEALSDERRRGRS